MAATASLMRSTASGSAPWDRIACWYSLAKSSASRWRRARSSVAFLDGEGGSTAVSATICFWTVSRFNFCPAGLPFCCRAAASGRSVNSMKYSGERPTPGPSTSLASRASAWYATSSYSAGCKGASASAIRAVTLPFFTAPMGTSTRCSGSPSLWYTNSTRATPKSSEATASTGTTSVGRARMSCPGWVISMDGGASARARMRRTAASMPGRPWASARTTVKAMLESTATSMDHRRSSSRRRGMTAPLVRWSEAADKGTLASNVHDARVPRTAATSGVERSTAGSRV